MTLKFFSILSIISHTFYSLDLLTVCFYNYLRTQWLAEICFLYISVKRVFQKDARREKIIGLRIGREYKSKKLVKVTIQSVFDFIPFTQKQITIQCFHKTSK